MENNEIMNYEDVEVLDGVIETEEKTGMGTGLAMLLGAGLTLALGAGVKAVKWGIKKIRAKKELREVESEAQDGDQDIE